MTGLVAGGATLMVLTVVLIAGGWRLVVLDRDLTRLDEELMRLQDELHSLQQRVGAGEQRQRENTIMTREHRHYLEWLDPWIRYFVAASQERGR